MNHNRSDAPGENIPPTLPPEPSIVPPTTTNAPTHMTPRIAVDSFETLHTPSGAGAYAPPPLSGYEILGKLGEGGMGVVFKARQIALNRLVALKMIRAGELAKNEDFARFRLEYEAVARLEHPNIIRIYDVSEHEGQPCFAMELADSGSLADRLNGKPLPPLEAARMAETLARAMHHAHQRGIVHRDLKPVNVLLSSSGSGVFNLDDPNDPSCTAPLGMLQPKISDFGLAKRLDSKGRTETGRLLGTVNYMAPEQAEGRSRDVGPHTDVYGLGAILYELLTGRPPFMADSIIATLEMVREKEPQAIRELNTACPRDLETICLKCLEKDPAQRYGSAQEIAEDLARFQAGEPIKARPVSTFERVWRVVQRRRREVLLAGSAVLIIALLAVFLIRQSILKEQREQQARTDYLEAVGALEEAATTLRERTRPAEQMLPLLRALQGHYQQVQQQVEDAELRERAARACANLGDLLWRGGRKDEASDASKTATQLYESLQKAHPERTSYRDALALVLLRQGQIHGDFRDYDAAEREYQAALAYLKAICESEPDNRDYQRHFAEAHHLMGVMQDQRKLRRQAIRAYQESLAIRQRLADSDPMNRSYRRDLARSHGYLGDTYLELGEVDNARDAYEASEKIRQKLADENPNDAEALFQLARSHANTGYYWQWLCDRAESVKAFDRARDLQLKLVEQYPEVADYKSDLGWSLLNSAEQTIDLQGPSKEVIDAMEQARRIFAELSSGSDDDRSYARNLARSHINLALCRRATDPEQTRASLLAARRILERFGERDRKLQQAEDPDDLYLLALVESLDGSILPKKQEQKRWEYANQGMSDLDYAIRRGYAKANRLGRDVAGLKFLWEIDDRRMTSIQQRCHDLSKSTPRGR